MKKTTLILGTATLFAIGSIAITGCRSAEQKNEETEQHEHMKGKMQKYEGMEEEMSEIEITQCPKWKDGEHQHATYICPMWEEEGESNEPGECSKCGMELVKFEDVKEKHDQQKHGDKDHDSHEH